MCQNRQKYLDSKQVLHNNTPESKAYKDELAALLEKSDPATVVYHFDHYENKDGADYLYINVNGEVEGMAVVTVKHWDEHIEKIKAFKGKGYGGAEFKNLKLEVTRDSVSTSFIYKGVDAVID